MRLLPYHITHGKMYTVNMVDYFLFGTELYWLGSMVNVFFCSRGCGQYRYRSMPRWSLLLSHLSLRAVIPWVLATIIITFVEYYQPNHGQAQIITHTACRMVLDQFVMNYFLFACLPPEMKRFLCCSLTHAVQSCSIPWLKIAKAWAFSWDSYYDDPQSQVSSESGDGPLTWRRKCMLEGTPRSFVTSMESDTHALFSLCDDGMLVVSFRGTGSLSNVSTDCNFGRRPMTIVPSTRDGLLFDLDNSGPRPENRRLSRLLQGATAARDNLQNLALDLASR